MLLENFLPQQFEETLNSRKSTLEQLQNAFFAYGQHRVYLDRDTRKALDKALLESEIRHQEDTAELWVDALFDCLGAVSKDALNNYELDPAAPPKARALAGGRIGSLKEEDAFPFADTQKIPAQWDLLRNGPLVTPESITGQLRAQGATVREDAYTHGYAHVVAPDCDGTLWHGDIGDSFFDRAITQRWLMPQSSPVMHGLCDRYGIQCYDNPNDTAKSMMQSRLDASFLKNAEKLGIERNEAYRQFYSTQALALAGLSVGFIKARTFEIMDEPGGLKEKIFPQIKALLDQAALGGMVVVPISASLHMLVEIGVTFLGIPGRRALGVTTPHVDGIIQPRLIEPMPYGKGKITLISQLGGLPPAIALGDSWQRTDKELLEGAGIGLVITHDGRPSEMPEQLICLDTAVP